MDNSVLVISSNQDLVSGGNFPKNPPSEVVQHIFRFLSPESLAEVRLVNHFFRNNADALMEVVSYWVGALSRLKPEAAVSLLRKLFEHSEAEGMAISETQSRFPFNREMLTTIWLRASAFRPFSEKILMAVYCFCRESRPVPELIPGQQEFDQALNLPVEIITDQAFADFWNGIVKQLNFELVSSSSERPAMSAGSIMGLFNHKLLRRQHISGRAMISHYLSLATSVFSHGGLMKALITFDPYALRIADGMLTNNHDLVLAAVKKEGRILAFASEALQANREIVLTAVENDGVSLGFASESLLDNQAFILTAIELDPVAYHLVPSHLRFDPDFQYRVAKIRPEIFGLRPEDVSLTFFEAKENGGFVP